MIVAVVVALVVLGCAEIVMVVMCGVAVLVPLLRLVQQVLLVQ